MSPLKAIIQVLFPTTCAACGRVLVEGERQVCIGCLADMAATAYSKMPGNGTERLLFGRIHLETGTSIYYFKADNTVRRIVHAMKFHGNTELCRMMGRQMGLELLRSGRFDDVDVLVPVPLHWIRRLQRGYNQSELLCRGIADVMPREVNTTALVRKRHTKQQSRQSGQRRADNVADAFSTKRPDELTGRHVLLVDDVLTTGATLCACADALATVPGIKISVATFSVAAG